MTSKKSRGGCDRGDTGACFTKIKVGGEGQSHQCSIGSWKDDGFVDRKCVSFEIEGVLDGC